MTVHQSLRGLLASAVLLVAGMTFDAPVAAAACSPHAPTAHHLLWSHMQPYGYYGASAPRVTATQPRMEDPFADMHME